jgi:hypothetical protein
MDVRARGRLWTRASAIPSLNCGTHGQSATFAYLLAPHGVVEALAIQQLFVTAVLDDPTALKDIDAMRVEHR